MPRRAASRAIVEPLLFRRAPLAAAALALALGIALGHHAQPPLVVLLAALVLLLALTLLALWKAARIAQIPALAVWVLLGMAAIALQPSGILSADILPFGDGLSRTVVGHVVRVQEPLRATAQEVAEAAKDADDVPPWEAASDTAGQNGQPTTVDLQTDAVEDVTPDTTSMAAIHGGVRIAVFGPLPALRCGDRVQVALRMRQPPRFRDPGVFQLADLMSAQGMLLQASVMGTQLADSHQGQPDLACRLAAAQLWSARRLANFVHSPENQRLPPTLRLTDADAGMLDAMLFGDRAGLTHRLRQGFERTGSFHLFVVSGVHIALLAGGVFWLLRRMRVRPWLATALTLIAATAYAALTGFGQPAQRSLAMTAVFLIARLLSRDRSSLNALGAAVLAMLAWSPRSLFEASLQMTALAILAIAGIAIPLGDWTILRYARVTRDVFARRRPLPPRDAQFRLMLELWGEAVAGVLPPRWHERTRHLPAMLLRVALWTGELALVGLVAELVLVLPMAVYFHRAAVLALPTNMLVLPLIGLLLPAAMLTFVASLLSPWLALVPGAATAFLLHALAGGIAHVSRFAVADVRVPGPASWVGVLALLGWLACAWLVRRARWGAWLTAAALPALAALVLWPEPVRLAPNRLELTALDVGQGDSLLLITPGGHTMMIDCGGPVGRGGNAETVSHYDVGEQVVAPYLWHRRIRHLDVLVLSHAHTDHMGGMPAILADFRPRELWVSIDPHSVLYANLLQEAAAYGVTVRHFHAGDTTTFDSLPVRVLAPAIDYTNPAAPKNDDSLVLEMRYGQSSILLEGDAEKPSEKAMLAAGLVHPVTLLKVGHHGSKTSSMAEFLAAAQPREAVISVGRHNTFGHPRGEVIARFAAAHIRLFRTDLEGIRSFFLDPHGGLTDGTGEP